MSVGWCGYLVGECGWVYAGSRVDGCGWVWTGVGGCGSLNPIPWGPPLGVHL